MSVNSVEVESVDFPTAPDIARDRWGRPLIVPPTGGAPIGHTRASSAGKPLEDTYNLALWQQRQVLRGALKAAGLLLKVEAIGEEPERGDFTMWKTWKSQVDDLGPEPDRSDVEAWTAWQAAIDELGDEPDSGANYKAWKDALNALVQEAHEAVGSHDRAELGTYLHDVFDAIHRGIAAPPIPAKFADYTAAMRDRDVAATLAETAGWLTLCRERFVVNDEWTIAGTLDALVLVPIDYLIDRVSDRIATEKRRRKPDVRRLAWLSARLDAYSAWKAEGVRYVVLVGDNKTGRKMDFGGLAYTAQVAAYADAVLFDLATGERASYLSLLPEGIDAAVVRIDRLASMIVHTPVGTGRCDVYDVPLDEGRAAIAMAADVRSMRNESKRWLALVSSTQAPRVVEQAAADGPVVNASDPVDRIADLIAATTSIEELLALRERELATVDYSNDYRTTFVVPWTDEHEALAAARAALLRPKAPEQIATEADLVMAEIERADSISVLRGVYAVHKDAWTSEYDAAAAARAERIHAAATTAAAAVEAPRELAVADLQAPKGTPSAPFSAAFDGECAECGGFIGEGDEIRMYDGAAICADCSQEIVAA